MGRISELGRRAWRKYVTDGVSSSGFNTPSTDDIFPVFDTIDAMVEGAAAGNVGPVSSWAQLAAIAPTRNGQPGYVTTADSGTHTDPVVGGTVSNSGTFVGSLSPLGWRRTGAYVDASSKADQSALDTTNAAVALKADKAALDTTNANLAAEITARQALSDRLVETQNDIEIGNWSRPGEAHRLWTHHIEGAPGDLSPISPSLVRIDSEGNVVRITGANKIGPIRAYRIEAGRLYRVRFAVRRRVNPADPANHTVRLAIRWLSRGKGALPTAMTVVQDLNSFVVASGRTIVTKVISTAAGTGVDIVAPAGAVYLRPYGQTYGDDGTTDFEIIDLVDVTDAINFSPDVSGLESRMSEQESIDAGTRLDEIESQLGGAEIRDYLTRATVESATISATVNAIRVMQYDLMTPLAPAVYARAPVEPSHEAKVQSYDGAWWVLAEDTVTPQMLGAKGDGIADDFGAIDAALRLGRAVDLPGPARYRISDTLRPYLDGQSLTAPGKELVEVFNSTNDKILFIARKGDAPTDYVRRGTLRGITFRGNPTTLGGCILPSITDDGLSGDSSKAWTVDAIKIDDVGNGIGFRVSSWCNNIGSIEVWNCKKGFSLGSESNSNSIGLLYLTGCAEEAFVAPAGGFSSTTYIAQIVAQYSADNANQAVLIEKHFGLHVGSMYLEGNGGTANCRITEANGTRIDLITLNRVDGSQSDGVHIDGNLKSYHIGNLILLGGTMNAGVRITGTLPIGSVGGVFAAAGTFSDGGIVDASTRKATTYLDPTASRFGPSAIRALITQNALEVRRSDTDVLQMFVKNAELYFGADETVPRLSRSGSTVSLLQGTGRANFRAETFTLGADTARWLYRDAGTPEASNTADPGSMCSVRTGVDAGLWFKLTGTGSVGWIKASGTNNGTTANRPANTRRGESYFDTTLNRPIWWDGTVWRDATGTAV